MVRLKEPSIPIGRTGVNPTIPLCPYCGKAKNEIILLGSRGDKLAKSLGRSDGHLPMYTKIPGDWHPCDDCAKDNVVCLVAREIPRGRRKPVIEGARLIHRGILPHIVNNRPLVEHALRRGFLLVDRETDEKIEDILKELKHRESENRIEGSSRKGENTKESHG